VIRSRPSAHDVAVELERHGATGLWTLMAPFALALAAQVGFIVHQISLLEPHLGESCAALTVSATAVAALLGRIALGVLSDRVDLRDLSAFNIGAQGVALVVMATWPSPAIFVAASLVFGLGVGNLITLPPLLAREEFGQRSFGTVFGLVAATAQVGVALGPGLMGVLHDALGSYRPVLWCRVGLESLAVAAMLWGKALREGPSANHVDNRLGRA
jgi:MFS family permease